MAAQDPITIEVADLDLTPRTQEVELGGRRFVLKETSGQAATTYRNAVLRGTQLGPDGRPTRIDGLAGIDALLVSMCLFEKLPDGAGGFKEKPVTEKEILAWPNRVYEGLAKIVKRISNLEDMVTRESLQKRIEEAQAELARMDDREELAKNS